MKQKLFIVTLLLLGLFFTATGYSQSLYSSEDDLNAVLENDATSSDFSLANDFGLRRESGSIPTVSGVPVGEGILLLSVLGGGYALLKKRNTKKD